MICRVSAERVQHQPKNHHEFNCQLSAQTSQMSDNVSQNEATPKKSIRRPKLDRTALRLPTPPPDPWELSKDSPKTPTRDDDIHDKTRRSSSGVSEKDREIFEYIESLHKNTYSRSTSTFSPAIVTEEAFDHLEKLYKLMEQMLELREQNVKLHRRIRDLEHLSNLEKLHASHADNPEEAYPDLDKDATFAETILDSILQDTKNKVKNQIKENLINQCQDLKYKSTRPSLLRRPRSSSATDKQISDPGGDKEGASQFPGEKSSKISKWTKVKAAFKWEKASNVGDSKSQDSGIHVPVNYELAHYLRVPSTSDETGQSPGDSGAGISTPGSISSASSNDDLRMGRTGCEDFRSSDDENLLPQYIPHNKTPRSHGQKSHHHSRTPWAKMKDIIHTKGSLKKKHRLSAASDDIQIDIEFCSDNEDVFETDDGPKSANMSLSPSPNVYSNSSVSPAGSDLPLDVIERYQLALAEDSASENEAKPSKWNRVRKAFLTQQRRNRISHTRFGTEDADNEIQRNYKRLQKKLSLEFKEKIDEWERNKQNSPGGPNSPTICGPDDFKRFDLGGKSPTDQHRRIQMTREYELPPDFKKKLREWEKIKKSSRSGSGKKKLGEITKWKSLGPRSPDHSPVFECPPLSEDFRKKLDEWRHIKSGGSTAKRDKSPSPKLSRKNSSQKQKKVKELHWFERELGKIEKEKQRLERERQKFIDREERLSKLRRSMIGAPAKKEILIHTPSGFHRYEGISRKFTKKLYEWEKSRGIAPEESTFALLSSPYAPDLNQTKYKNNTASLPRSKSADSIAISALNLTCPLMSGHPSSLSLNDMEELEKDLSKSSSMHFLLDDRDDEPEAVLVEVEDYEEETTEPLRVSCCVERQQLPVYQRQEFKPLCESETLVVPKVRRSESKRAQINYDHIEDVLTTLTKLLENENEIKECSEQSKESSFHILNELQLGNINELSDSLQKLLNANDLFTQKASRDKVEDISIRKVISEVTDSTKQIIDKVDEMRSCISFRVAYSNECADIARTLVDRVTNLRRQLNRICSSLEQKLKVAKSTSGESSDRERRYVKLETSPSPSTSHGAVKKRIKLRQKTVKQIESDEDDDRPKVRQHKKLTRTRSTSEGNEPIQFDPKLVAPCPTSSRQSPVMLFVKTTRKLFTPLVETNLAKSEEVKKDDDKVVSLPPLPASPVPQRKLFKDVSPSIKLIMAKYNQNIEKSTGIKSGGSSGSNSPIAWRSPVSERRVKVQTEKYQEELIKMSPILGVHKSSSASIIQPKQTTLPDRKASLNTELKPILTLDIDLANKNSDAKISPEVRMRKLQKAKEEFLKTPLSAPSYVSHERLEFPSRNRLSQISVDSDMSFDVPRALVKSASAGMINVDPDVYSKINPEYRPEGYVSLPRQTNVSKLSGKFAFSNIASKFRKVKMRRGKDKDKDKQAVATLCRQSLVVNISDDQNEERDETGERINNGDVQKSEEPTSTEVVKSHSWIRRSLFKK